VTWARRIRGRLAQCLVLGALTVGLKAEPVRLDFAVAGDNEISVFAMQMGQWRIDGSARYDINTQTLTIAGKYWTGQAIQPGANLSYQVYARDGELLLMDGARYALRPADENGLATRFVLDLPLVAEDPLRPDFDVRFNAVVEGQFWYQEEFPEMGFAELEIRNLPPRDRYEPTWIWRPGVLPAEFETRVPARWRVGFRDASRSKFVPSVDLTRPEDGQRVRSVRADPALIEDGTFNHWLPIGRQEVGTLMVRPGLVWDGLRWYEAHDWFERKPVRFVSPLWFLGGLSVVGLGAFALMVLSWRIRVRSGRWFSLAVAAGISFVWALHAYASGFWPAVVVLAVTGVLAGARRLKPSTRVYAVAWLYLVFVDYFWGFIDGVSRAHPTSVVFAAGVWALFLLPLRLIRRLPVQIALAGFITVGWWFATVVGVVYFEFFRDFPSVGDLFYARQIGELGDSVGSLMTQRHWVPLVLWGLMMVLAGAVARIQRKTQAEKT